MLAATLVGIPVVCCIIGGYDEILDGVRQFPPRTEDWGLHPERLWNFRRPFNWWWFGAMLAFTFASLMPLVRRGIVNRGKAPPPRKGGHFPVWGWGGLALLIAAWIVTWNRFEWFKDYQVILSYFPVWMGYIVTVNALVKWRRGSCPLTGHPLVYALTFPLSSLFWWFFEFLNRFVWNWYYLGIAKLSAGEYTLYATLCFASVLPAVYATAELLGTFPFVDDHRYDGMAWRPDVRSNPARAFLAALSVIGLGGIVFFPEHTFMLLWISPLMVFALIQSILGEPSVLDGLKFGSWGIVFRYSIAALVCGLCWETWNYYALAKWVYAVPWVHRWQIWEMPVIGFAGYLPFGVECAAVIHWLYDGFGLGKSITDPYGTDFTARS